MTGYPGILVSTGQAGSPPYLLLHESAETRREPLAAGAHLLPQDFVSIPPVPRSLRSAFFAPFADELRLCGPGPRRE